MKTEKKTESIPFKTTKTLMDWIREEAAKTNSSVNNFLERLALEKKPQSTSNG